MVKVTSRVWEDSLHLYLVKVQASQDLKKLHTNYIFDNVANYTTNYQRGKANYCTLMLLLKLMKIN